MRRRAAVGLLLLAGIAWGAVASLRVAPPPRLSLAAGRPAIGRRTPVTVTAAAAGRGLSRLTLELIQGERVHRLLDQTYAARPAWSFWGPRVVHDELRVEVGRETLPALQPGQATLRATAERAGTWLRRPAPVVQELSLPVRLTPPGLSVQSTQHYLAQGGAEVVVYRVGESAVRDGVRAGAWWFGGQPLPGGGPHDRFAFFAAPYDLADASAIRLAAEDDVGNRAEQAFVDRYTPRPVRTATLEVSDALLAKVVPEILSHTPELAGSGSLLESYLMINGELRRRNNARLKELAAGSQPRFLWEQPFLPWRNAQVMSSFADRRSYVYGGQVVDRQDHLGFDLATTQQAPMPAANAGRVVLAEYLGIYGNTVVIDHGYGLMTLYGHLSAIDVRPGQEIARGQVIGRSGQTGLAGGDHLHFTVLLQGLPVDPREWWDGHWIRDRIARKLGAAFPFRE